LYLTAEMVSCICSWKVLLVCMPVRKRRRMGCRQLIENRKEINRADQ
jgi:hypothetical protein